MILFLNDWAKYPTAIADTKTTNTSWVKLARLYRKMGIKNHAFHLALINPLLQGVDPHDPHLSQETIEQIAVELKLNPWYYFREVARVPVQGVNDKPKLEANRGNIYLWWSFFNHVFTILIQIRQTGKSLSTDQLTVYLMHVLCQGTKINLLTKDDKLRRENIGRLKDIIGALPYYINQTTRRDIDNGEEITVRELDNILKTHLPKRNKQDALNSGRGMTTPIMFIDEGPFQPNIRIALPAALAAMGAARETAELNATPYGVIMTTTAGQLNEDSGAYIYEFVSSAAVWDESYLDARDREHLYQMILANSVNEVPTFNGTFSHRQLGKDDAWLKTRMANAHAKGEDAARDFLNKWTSGTSMSPFPPDVADRLEAAKREAVFVETDPQYHYRTYWYVPEDVRDRYVATSKFLIGLDTSEGTGRDFVGLTYIDPRSMNVIGTAMLNSLSMYIFTEYIADLLERLPNAILIPERKNTGVTLVDALMQILPDRGIDPFKRIFNWIVQDPVTYERQYDEIRQPMGSRDRSVYVRYRNLMGFATAGSGEQSRDKLFGIALNIGTGRYAERINDKRLIDQLLKLEKKNGRINHRGNQHDDLVVSWLLPVWMLIEGRNLHYYGLNPMEVMSVAAPNQSRSKDEGTEREQRHLRKRIEELLARLEREADPYIVKKLESEIMFLDSRLIPDQNEIFNITELMSKAKERKKRSNTLNRGYGGGYDLSYRQDDLYQQASRFAERSGGNLGQVF